MFAVSWKREISKSMVCVFYQLCPSHIHYNLEGFIGNNNGDGEVQQGDATARHRGEQQVAQDHRGMSNHGSSLFLH
jgi:hypothetical protein